jgi:hypothetical protein
MRRSRSTFISGGGRLSPSFGRMIGRMIALATIDKPFRAA